MQPKSNGDVEVRAERDLDVFLDAIESRKKKLIDELAHLDALIAMHKDKSAKVELKSITQLKSITKPKPPRVRGVLAAARKAIEQLQDPFDKNELTKLIENNEEFAQKKISATNIRNSLRILTQAKVIKIESEATSTTCAKYCKVR
jgi:hypothetical protein